MHAKLRVGTAGSLVVMAALVMASVAAQLLGESGSVSSATSSSSQQPVVQDAVPFRLATGPTHVPYFAHSWVIPVGRRSISVPILMYHYIRTPPSIISDRLGFNLSVTPSDFSLQMDWLVGQDYHPVNFNDLRAYFAGRQALPSKPVVLTFDDGYSDLYTTAFPILQAHSLKAVAYIVSGFVGKSGYVTAAQVVEMSQYGIEIASHTVNHADLPRTPLPMIMVELLESKARLQHLVGHAVIDFAYPSGRFNAQVIGAVYLAGYASAVTTISGTYHSLVDRFAWTRIRVGGGELLSEFAKSLGPVETTVEITRINADLMSS